MAVKCGRQVGIRNVREKKRTMSVGDLGEQVQTHSKVVSDLVGEVGKVLVGQEAMVSR